MAPEGDTTGTGIVLSAPEAGAEILQQITPGATVDLGNLMEQVTSLTRDGNDFILSFENGGKITLQNFFPADAPEETPTESADATEPAAAAGTGPSLIIDGQEVPYDTFMANYGDGIEAAAGPTATATAAAAAGGSGIGGYADSAGNLIDGIGALGKLGIITWETADPYRVEDTGVEPSTVSVSFNQFLTLSTSSINESAESFSVFLNLSAPQPTPTTITFNVSGSATFLNSLAGEDGYRADVALPNGFTLTQMPNGTWNITVVIPAGSSGISLTFPLVDDHITEINPEPITITVVNIIGNVTGIGATGTITITDDDTTHAAHNGDNEIGVLDGPIVGVIDVTEQAVPNNVMLMAAEADGSRSPEGYAGFEFQITLTDPHTLESYEGYKGDNLLSQDLTIVLKPGMGDTATYGKDYEFNVNNLLEVAGVKSAEVGEDGTITIVLSGRVDENGVPYPPNSPVFNMNDVPNLIIKTEIINDTETELTGEDLTINVDSVSGNESSVGEGSGATIDPDNKWNLNGPVVHVGVNSINESASELEKLSPEDNPSGKITIDLRNADNSNEHQTADEGIPMTITIGGGSSGAKYGAGNPKDASGNEDLHSDVDYYLSGNWEDGEDSDGNPCLVGKLTITNMDGTTQEVDAFRYDDLSNNKTEIKFEMPKNGVSTEIGYTANDDLFETEPEKDSFEVSVTLTPKGQDPYGNDIAYGEATVNNPSGEGPSDWLTSTPETGNITEDVRDGLNPADFDGPFVQIVANKSTVNETPEAGATGPNTVGYTLSLLDPSGNGNPYTADEAVTVTLSLGADPNSPTFFLNDLFAPTADKSGNFTYDLKYQAYDADGNSVGSVQTITITGNGADSSLDFSVQLPAGSTNVRFELPINDDPLGADADSKFDKPAEDFSLSISGLEGNEARADASQGSTSAKVTINDDVQDNVNTTTDDGALEGIRIGLAWQETASSGIAAPTVSGNEAIVDEDKNYAFKVQLFAPNGSALTKDNNPYVNYTGGNTLPEDLTIKMNFSGTPGGDDLILSMDYRLAKLIHDGKAEITINGVTYTKDSDLGGSTDTANILNLAHLRIEPGTDIVLKIYAGQDLDAIKDNLVFNPLILGDKVNEWDSKYEYLNSAKDAERFDITITEVKGNESVIATDQNGTQLKDVIGQITDVANGYFAWNTDSGAENATKTGWDFSVKVDYLTGEQHGAGNLPGESVHLQLKFTDSEAMQHGEEYKVDAYSLFVSINGGNHGITESEYNGLINGLSHAELLALTTDASSPLNDLTIVAGGNWVTGSSGQDSATFDVYAPKSEFADGQLDFSIVKGNEGTDAAHGGFDIELVDPYPRDANGNPTGAPNFDMKGEVVNVDNTGANTEVGGNIVLNLSGGSTIYEDDALAAAKQGSTLDTYKVSFTGDNGAALTSPAANITFDMVITQTSAKFDFNTTDNNDLANIKDFAFGDANGNAFEYSDITSLQTALNGWLSDTYGPGNVSVTGINTTGNDIKLSFDIKEGFEVPAAGIEIHFKALDDAFSDNNENFTVKVENVGSYIEGSSLKDPLNISIGTATGTTTILDETGGDGDLDGPFVKLTGTEAINESGENNTASYKVSLHDPKVGSSGNAFAALENVTVSLKITADSDTFKMSDLNFKDANNFKNLTKQPDGTWKVEVKIVDGDNNPTWTNMTITADGKSATVEVVVPTGQSEANFSLPALDDYYGGGRGTAGDPVSASKNDTNEESFSITITGVKGNEARVENGDVNAHGKVQTTITDDLSQAANQYGTQDGPTVNVVIGQALSDSDKEVKEGTSHNLTLKLTDASNAAFKIDPNSVAYDAKTGNVLQEDLTVTLNFGGTAVTGGSSNEGNSDYTVSLKGTNFDLTSIKDYSVDLGSGCIVKVHSDGQGNLTITVPAGTSIDASGNIVFPGSNLSVTVANDASSEPGYQFNQQTGKIETTSGGANDTLEVKVTDTFGHESVVGKGDQVEILDAAKYYLGIKDNASTVEGGDLAFTLQLYSTSGSGTSTTSASGLKQDTLVQLKFSPKGDLTADAASHSDLSGYKTDPASYQQDYDLEAIKVALQGQGYGVIDVRFVDADDPSQGIYVTFNIPATEWNDGQYKFYVPTIKDTISESNEYLNVDLVAVGGNDIFKHTNSNYTHKEGTITENNVGVEISVIGTDAIYEDPDHGAHVKGNANRPTSSYDANKDGQKDTVEGDAGNLWNTASYTIQIKTPDYEKSAGDGKVDQGFNFKVNLLNGSANYGDDFQWSWQAEGIDPSTPEGLTALNAYLGLPEGVKVIAVENGGRTLRIEVAKDTKYEDIESGIKINVISKDDYLTEPTENYKVTISAPSQEGHAEIGREHTQNTNILDDEHLSFKDGFQVGVGKATVNESEGFVNVPILLYNNDGYALNLSSTNNGGEAIKVMVSGQETTMYLPVGYTLSQYMTVTLSFGSSSDTASPNQDYDANVTQYNFPKGYVWEVVDLPGGGQALQGYAKVELTDDRFSEGPEDFTVTIDRVQNNESLPYQNKATDAPGTANGKITILDDDIDPAQSGNTIGQEAVKDGPTLIYFDPTTKLHEPVDVNNPGNPNTPDRVAEYRMLFDQIASEPIAVMLNLGGVAILGTDYSLGEGIYQVGSTLTGAQLAELNSLIAGSNKYLKIEFDTNGHTIKSVTTISPEGTPNVHNDGYFVVVPKGSAQAKFTVNIKHDNDEKAIDQSGDVDHGKENIIFKITDIAGSESWIADTNQHKTSDNAIEDDMRGPAVSLSGSASVGYDQENQTYNTAEYKVSMSNTATEDVKVYIDIMDNGNGLAGTRYAHSDLHQDANGWYVIIPAGKTEAGFTITPSGGDFFYVKQGGVSGGEAQSGGGFVFTDIGGGTGGTHGHYVVNLGDDLRVTEGDTGDTTPVSLGGTLTVPADMITDASYHDCTIKFVILGGSATNGTDYRIEQSITLTADQIKALVDQAKLDGSYTNGNLNIDLAEALKDVVKVIGDTLIEGNENLVIGIIDVSNGTVGSNPTTNVTIIDDDEAYFLITPVATGDVDGDTIAREGGEMRFEIKLVDENGNPLQLAEGIDVRVQINGGQGEGSDFTLKTDIVTIGPDGKGYVTVNFPNDYITENDKPLDIKVTEFVNADLNSQTMLDKINLDGDITINGSTVPSNSGNATLRDDYTGTDADRVYDDGPTVSIRPVGGSTLTEGTSMSFMIRVDMVPEEDVEVVLTLGGNIDQLKYVDQDGNAWTSGPKYLNVVDIKGNITGKALLNDDGTCTVTLPKGHSQVLLQVAAADDTITEAAHKFTVKIKETHGGETEGHFDTTETTVTIKDNMNGPLVVLTANQPEITEEAGHANFTIALQGRTGNGSTSTNGQALAADEDITITLQMNNTWMEATRQGGKVEYLGSDSQWHEVVVNGSNQFTVTVPAGETGLNIRVKVNDNSELDGKLNLEMTVVNTQGGESAVVKGLNFAQNQIGETGYGLTYELDCAENSSASDSIITVTLTNVDLATLKTITLYGQTIDPANPPAGYTVTQSSTNVVITSTIHAGSPLDTSLTVNFKGDTDTVIGYKEQMGVSVSGSRVAGTVITDEAADSTSLEGPVVGLELAVGHLSDPDNPKVTEGNAITGKLVVQMPNLPGDANVTSESITITLQVSQNPDGTYSKITVDGKVYTPTGAGIVKIPVAEGTAIGADGKIELNLTVNVPDNALANNPDFSIKVTDVLAPGYETAGASATTGSVNITVENETNAADGPAFTISNNVSSNVTEGETITFNLSSNNACWKQASGMEAKIEVTGLQPGDQVKDANGNLLYTEPATEGTGEYIATIAITSNNSSASGSLKVVPADLTSPVAGREVTVDVVDVVYKNGALVGQSVFEKVTSTPANVTVTSNDGIQLKMQANFDAASNELMFTIALAAVGGYAPTNGLLTEPVSFQINLDGLDDTAKTALADQISLNAGVAATYENSVFTVTLETGYPIADSLDFTVPATPGVEYDVAINNITATNLVASAIDAAHDSFSIIHGTAQETEVTGTASNDVIFALNGVDSTLIGGEGDDLLIGGTGNTTLDGGLGNDMLIGGSGSDTMIGGAGDNTFVWKADALGGADSILDFKASDTIDLRDLFSSVGDGKDLDSLITAGHIKFDQNDQNEKAIDIKISTEDLNSGGNVEQIITVNFADHESQSYDELQAMLQLHILTNSN